MWHYQGVYRAPASNPILCGIFIFGERRAEYRTGQRSGAHDELVSAVFGSLAAWIRQDEGVRWSAASAPGRRCRPSDPAPPGPSIDIAASGTESSNLLCSARNLHNIQIHQLLDRKGSDPKNYPQPVCSSGWTSTEHLRQSACQAPVSSNPLAGGLPAPGTSRFMTKASTRRHAHGVRSF